jgi:hypothetical protein
MVRKISGNAQHIGNEVTHPQRQECDKLISESLSISSAPITVSSGDTALLLEIRVRGETLCDKRQTCSTQVDEHC